MELKTHACSHQSGCYSINSRIMIGTNIIHQSFLEINFCLRETRLNRISACGELPKTYLEVSNFIANCFFSYNGGYLTCMSHCMIPPFLQNRIYIQRWVP